MKQLQLFAPRDLRLVEVDRSSPARGEVLVRIESCGICTLEQRLYAGEMRIFYPIVPGHEAAGIVEEVGAESITALAPGDKVSLDLVYRCGECYWCRNGQSNHCANRFAKSVRPLGGFSEYMVVGTQQCFQVPLEIPSREACFAEPLACCIHSLRTVSLKLGEDLLVVGAGPMGLLHTLVARKMGARVIVADPLPQRRSLAEKLGADLTMDSALPLKQQTAELTGGRGVDVAVVTAPVGQVLREAAMAVRKGGRVSAYSAYSDTFDLPVDTNYLHRSEVSVFGVEGRTERDFQVAVKLIATRAIDISPLISAECSLEDFATAMELAGKPDQVRVLFNLKTS
jgi:L-iditol 2-dehydrogenase